MENYIILLCLVTTLSSVPGTFGATSGNETATEEPALNTTTRGLTEIITNIETDTEGKLDSTEGANPTTEPLLTTTARPRLPIVNEGGHVLTAASGTTRIKTEAVAKTTIMTEIATDYPTTTAERFLTDAQTDVVTMVQTTEGKTDISEALSVSAAEESLPTTGPPEDLVTVAETDIVTEIQTTKSGTIEIGLDSSEEVESTTVKTDVGTTLVTITEEMESTTVQAIMATALVTSTEEMDSVTVQTDIVTMSDEEESTAIQTDVATTLVQETDKQELNEGTEVVISTDIVDSATVQTDIATTFVTIPDEVESTAVQTDVATALVTREQETAKQEVGEGTEVATSIATAFEDNLITEGPELLTDLTTELEMFEFTTSLTSEDADAATDIMISETIGVTSVAFTTNIAEVETTAELNETTIATMTTEVVSSLPTEVTTQSDGETIGVTSVAFTTNIAEVETTAELNETTIATMTTEVVSSLPAEVTTQPDGLIPETTVMQTTGRTSTQPDENTHIQTTHQISTQELETTVVQTTQKFDQTTKGTTSARLSITTRISPAPPTTIKSNEMTPEQMANSISLEFNMDITKEQWMEKYDQPLRNSISNMIPDVRPEDIVYISPTPMNANGVIYVSFLILSNSRSSRRRRDAEDKTYMDGESVTEVIKENMDGLESALNLPPGSIKVYRGLPEVVEKPPSSEKPDTGTTDDGRDAGAFTILASPALFIALIVIGSISVVIITVGFIYLVCDRRRSTRGEYITNADAINRDLDLGIDNPAMLQDKAISNGNGAHLISIKIMPDEQDIVPYDSFTQEEILNCEVEDTHL